MKLVVGIDPGTTVGWAVLDLKGAIVTVSSEKGVSLDSLVSRISKLGTVIVVGCDKSKTPSFVDSFGKKFHAKVISPKADVLVSEKRSLTKEFNVKNDHEMDALSSALLAYRKIQPLLRKIRINLERNGKLPCFEHVCDLVIREGLSIHAALALVEPEKVITVPETVEEQRDKDLVLLYSSLRSARREASALREKNELLSKEFHCVSQKLDALRKKSAELVRPKPAKKLAREKETRIHVLTSKVDRMAKSMDQLNALVFKLQKFLLRIDGRVALPRLARLSGTPPDILKDTIYVDDPNEFSINFVDKVSKTVKVIVYSKPPSRIVRNKLPFSFVACKVIEKFDSVVIVDKQSLKDALKSKDVLRNVIQKYKNSRFF